MDKVITICEFIKDKFTCHFDDVASLTTSSDVQKWAAPALSLTTLIAAAFALFKFYEEKRRDSARRTYDIYDKLRERFDSEEFYVIHDALYDYETSQCKEKIYAAQALRSINSNERLKYAALLEHVALVTKSGIIDLNLAKYQFGYYVQMCWKSDPFWDELCNKNDKGKKTIRDNETLWALLKWFAEELEKITPEVEKLSFNPRYTWPWQKKY